jgi:DHA1 family bicyclomycin/chloramphenicol resistance-like MFS transporter
MVGVMVYMFGQTLVQPNAVASALDPLRHMAGMGSALIGIIQMLCGAAGGYVVNRLFDGTPIPMGAVILAAALACTGLHRLLLRHLRPPRAA